MSRQTRPAPARDRLLAAAARVFARDGLAGATTRAIAREAGVNEVTLFRHFGSKARLITAVVGQNFGRNWQPEREPPPASDDLRADLALHARRYERLLQANLPLIRTMIGEIRHHVGHEHQVFKAIFRPLRASLVARLEAAQAVGALRADADAALLADLFSGMIFTGVLRRSSAQFKQEYPASDYLAGAVDLLVRGAAPAGR